MKSTAKSRMREHNNNKTTKSEKYPQISNSPPTGNQAGGPHRREPSRLTPSPLAAGKRRSNPLEELGAY
jgi:hypothetical protein